MPFRKKALYYGLMLFLTLLALEGMARIAYAAAYGQGYGRVQPDTPENYAPFPSAPEFAVETASPRRISHPFYGYTRPSPRHALNAMPPRQRRPDTAVIGLLGGSVAGQAAPFLQRELNQWFAANQLPRRPLVLRLANGAAKQPQQAATIANILLLGGEVDLIVNLDGFNEVTRSAGFNPADGVFPFFPHQWNSRVSLTAAELSLAGRIAALRQEHSRLTAAAATPWLRRSAVFGLVNRYQQERTAAAISQLNQQLAAAESAYSLEKHGPGHWPAQDAELLPAAAQVWYRGSLALARLAALSGAEYYHFLQPNQYAPEAKPLSREERELYYNPEGNNGYFAARGYPLLLAFNQDLQNQGVNYFDLTGIFADHPETLYQDDCCHLNYRGNELLAAAMAKRLEPALLRLGAATRAQPVSALAAARRPTEPDTRLIAAAFQVYQSFQGDGKYLRYVRADCTPADLEARFFLHLTPRDWADLPPFRREYGFDNRDFTFAQAGGVLWPGECQAQIRLPDYPLQTLRTGQYAPKAAGELWAGSYSFPE